MDGSTRRREKGEEGCSHDKDIVGSMSLLLTSNIPPGILLRPPPLPAAVAHDDDVIIKIALINLDNGESGLSKWNLS